MYSLLFGLGGAIIGHSYCKIIDSKDEPKFNYINMPSKYFTVVSITTILGFVAGLSIDVYRFFH